MNICQCFNTNSRGSGGQFVIGDSWQVVMSIGGDMTKALRFWNNVVQPSLVLNI